MNSAPIFDDALLIKYFKHLEKNLLFKNSASLILYLTKFAQDPDARRSYYLSCCWLAANKHAKEHFLWSEVWWFWKFSIFYISKNPKMFYKLMEYYFIGVSCFSPGKLSFYRKILDKPKDFMMPYSRFYLRTDAYSLFIMWYALEHIRMSKYHDIVKTHFFINKSEYLPIKWYFKEKLLRKRYYPKILSWRNRFYMEFLKIRYRLVSSLIMSNYMLTESYTLESAKLNTVEMLENKKLNLLKSLNNFPHDVAIILNGYYDHSSFIKLNLMSNYLISRYGHKFMVITRYDWEHFFETSWLFVSHKKIFGRFVKIWSQIYIKRLLTNFINTENVAHNAIISDFINFKLPINNYDENHRFFYYVWRIIINDYFEQEMFDFFFSSFYMSRKFESRNFKIGPQKRGFFDGTNFKGFLVDVGKKYFADYLFLGQFYNVNKFFGRYLCWIDHFHWRVWNFETEYNFLDGGRLRIHFLNERLDLDNKFLNNIVNLWSTINAFLIDSKIFYISKQMPERKVIQNKHKRKKPFRTVEMYGRTFSDKRLQLKLSNYLLLSSIQSIYGPIFYLSIDWGHACHFLFLKNHSILFDYFYSNFQERMWGGFALNYHLVRRARSMYKTYSTANRRFPNGNCLISKNNALHRETWFSFSDRMRRAGVPKEDMAFYPLNDVDDYFIELLQKVRMQRRKFMRLPKKLWIIY